jgi:RimJ/RimL family protein N-acetyltransferase
MDLRLTGARIRDWRGSDAPSLARHANNRKIWRNLRDFFPHPYTLDDARRWIESTTAADATTSFAIEVDGEAVGGIGLHPGRDVHRRSAEIGFWLGEPFWGRGIMTEAVQAVTRHAFDVLGLSRVHASVFEWNTASARVLEKAGYTLEATLRRAVVKDGKTIDALLYAIVDEGRR